MDGDGINSQNKEERIRARRARIVNKLQGRQSMKDGQQAAVVWANKTKEKKATYDLKAKEKMKEARTKLDEAKSKGLRSITDLKRKCEEHEAIHRAQEERKAEQRVFQLGLAKQQSDEQNAGVALSWSSLAAKSVPQDLMNALMEQKGRCDLIVAAKDNIISAFSSELAQQEEDYVNELQRQVKHVDALLKMMEEEFKDLQKRYTMELTVLEETFDEEITAMLKEFDTEYQELLEKRAKNEKDHIAKKQKQLADHQTAIEEIYRKNGETLNIATIQLQISVQILKQQLEEMRAMYSLNAQKLDYNISVLHRREVESNATIGQQKRKITDLQDLVASVKQRYIKQDQDYRAENLRVTEEYKRITEQYKELQRKYRHFQLADAKKFKEVWDLNEEKVAGLIHRVLQADKVLTEQQLGLAWAMPPEDVFTLRRPATSGSAMIARFGGEKVQITPRESSLSVVSFASPSPSPSPNETGTVSASASGTGAVSRASRRPSGKREGENGNDDQGQGDNYDNDDDDEEEEEEGGGGGAEREAGQRGNGVDDRDDESPSESERGNANNGRQQTRGGSTSGGGGGRRRRGGGEGEEGEEEGGGGGDSGRGPSTSSLSVRSTATIRTVLDMLCSEAGFLVDGKVRRLLGSLPADDQDLLKVDSIFKALNINTEADIERLMKYFVKEGADASGTAGVIHPDAAVAALRAFVTDHKRQMDESRATFSRSTSRTAMREQKERSRQEEREYWERLGSVVPDTTFRTWKALETALQKYHGLLESRAKRMTECDFLRNQNRELQGLLNQYLSAKVNDELIVPPARAIFDEAIRRV